MSLDQHELGSFSTFLSHLLQLGAKGRFECYRDLGLLQSQAKCPHCGRTNDLILPESDNKSDKTGKVQCKDKNCTVRHSYPRCIHFKLGSIFEHYRVKPIVVVLAIYTWCLQIQPCMAALLIGNVCAHTISRIYEDIRLAVQQYNTTHHRGKLGGRVAPDHPDAQHAVYFEGELRRVVEFDESE